jgi:hypothetical protein
MKYRVCLLVLCAFALQAQMQMNIQQLADFVRSELALKQHTDKQIAAYIKKLQLSEKLTDKAILDLEAQGAGPKTVQALQELRDQTAAMKPPTHDATSSPATAPDNTLAPGPSRTSIAVNAPPLPPPNSIRQQQILDLMKQYAMSYTQTLPNFMCVEVMRRYVDPNAGDHYRSIGNVLTRVSYNEGREDYKVYSINGHYEEISIDRAAGNGGAISTGEFGSMMREIFEPKSEAEFGWDHWATIRGRKMAAFNFFIDSGHSAYSITYSAGPGDEQRIITAYKGLVYADENTGEISRIKLTAVNIPRNFPVSQAEETLDYDVVEISGQPYVLPMAAKLYMASGREKSKNELEFRSYRKFDAGTVITYGKNEIPPSDVPPPLPASKTEEQPAGSTSQQQKPSGSSGSGNSGSTPWWAAPAPPPPPSATKPPQ